LFSSKKDPKMSIIEEKNLKVITFGGKQDDWKFWQVKFLARARGRVLERFCWELSQSQRMVRSLTSPSPT